MQKIKFDLNDVELNTYQLHTVVDIARAYHLSDIRITGEPRETIKVYVGERDRERYRFWVYDTGDFDLVEEDISPSRELGNWQPVAIPTATFY